MEPKEKNHTSKDRKETENQVCGDIESALYLDLHSYRAFTFHFVCWFKSIFARFSFTLKRRFIIRIFVIALLIS